MGLGWIFCSDQRIVWAAPEPFRMFADPGMIRRTLRGEGECNFQVTFAAGCDETSKIVQRAQLGMNGIMAAGGRADGVGAARIAVHGGKILVAALAMGPADRVDR